MKRQNAAAPVVKPSLYYYCSEPSTSGCSSAAATTAKKTTGQKRDADDGSDSDSSTYIEDESSEKGNIFEKATKRRCYSQYKELFGNRQIVIAFTNLTASEKELVEQLIKSFSVCIKKQWHDTVTHLVVHTIGNGICSQQSTMYMHALLSSCYIISIEWVKECLNSGFLVPESDYMVYDKYGEQTSLVSWSVGRGTINSPMAWTEYCILYFYGFKASDQKYLNTVKWAKKAGFVISKDVQEFSNEKFKFRFVISGQAKGNRRPPEVKSWDWLCVHKAPTVRIEWLMECLYQYKFVEITKSFQVLELDQEMIEHTDMVGYVLAI